MSYLALIGEGASGGVTEVSKTGQNCHIFRFSTAEATVYNNLECGPMPNVMAALPNIGGALCSTPQSLADAHY